MACSGVFTICGITAKLNPLLVTFMMPQSVFNLQEHFAEGTPFKANANLPSSPTREKWEAERAVEGSTANLYYEKYPKP